MRNSSGEVRLGYVHHERNGKIVTHFLRTQIIKGWTERGHMELIPYANHSVSY
jgi:hypothetical protein